MPCISGRFPPEAGLVIIDVFVIDYQKMLPVLSEDQKSAPDGQQPIPNGIRPYKALVDTGASATCISSRVAGELKLEAIGLGEMISASEKAAKNKYLFAIGIPFIHQADSIGQPVRGELHTFMPPVEGLEFHTDQDQASKFDVILGMDIIMKGSFKLDFDGHFSLCF